MTSPRYLDRTTPPHLSTLILLAGISALNMSIFLPSLNHMAAHFGTTYGVMQLAVPLYFATTALVQLVVGPLADRYGRRPVLVLALIIFIAASVGCIVAPNIGVFLVFRVVQGAIATGMVLSRAIVRDIFDTDRAASMLSYVIMGMSIVPMFGPMIGGALDEAFGWQASFVFLALSGAAVLGIVLFDLKETNPGTATSMVDQFRATPELLRAQRFWAYVLTAAFSAGAYFALLGGAAYVAGTVFGLGPTAAGLALGAPAIGYMLGNWISARFAARIGLDRMILWGAVVTLAFMLASFGLGVLGWHSPWIFFGFCTALGLGNGLVMPNVMVGMLSVRPKLAGTASGIGGAFQIGGGALLAALAGASLDGATTALPLQAIMAASTLGSVLTALWARARNRRLAMMG